MRLDLRALRERIREAEAGGHSDTPLRRAYNHKLRALKIPGGGPKQSVHVDTTHTEMIESLAKSLQELTGEFRTMKENMGRRFSSQQYDFE